METSIAEKNLGRCPHCDDELTEDIAGRGFVRHKTNNQCKWHNGKKDENVSTPCSKKTSSIKAITLLMVCLLGGTSCSTLLPEDEYGPKDSVTRRILEFLVKDDSPDGKIEYAEWKRQGKPTDDATLSRMSKNYYAFNEVDRIQRQRAAEKGQVGHVQEIKQEEALKAARESILQEKMKKCSTKFISEKDKLLAEWNKPWEEKSKALLVQLEKIRTTALVVQDGLPKEAIQPFGELNWDDGLYDVSYTLSAIKGVITTLPNAYGGNALPCIKRDIIINTDGNWFLERYGSGGSIVPFSTVGRTGANPKPLSEKVPIFNAQPVKINDVAFMLTVEFSNELGACVSNPAKTTFFVEYPNPQFNSSTAVKLCDKREDKIQEIFSVTMKEIEDEKKEAFKAFHVEMAGCDTEGLCRKAMQEASAVEDVNNPRNMKEIRQFPWAIKKVTLVTIEPVTSEKLDGVINDVKQKYPDGKMVVTCDQPGNRSGVFYLKDNWGFKFTMAWKPAQKGMYMVTMSYTRPDDLWDKAYKKYLEKCNQTK